LHPRSSLFVEFGDAVFANLDCAITHFNNTWRRSPKASHFRGELAMIDALRAGNIRCGLGHGMRRIGLSHGELQKRASEDGKRDFMAMAPLARS
jgi:hypothetical protein